MKSIQISQFTGPFDLLLSLVEQQELNITEIALSQVTEQYLNYLDTIEDHFGEDLADFLLVATRLLLIKSSRLLPQFALVEEDGPKLEDQLHLYRAFVEASKDINTLWESDQKSAFRIEPTRMPEEFLMPENVTLGHLHDFMVQLINRLKPLKVLPQTQIDRAVSLKEKIDSIRKMLKTKKKFNFREVLSQSGNKTDIIVGFLALLELVKQRHVGLSQEASFEDIIVNRV